MLNAQSAEFQGVERMHLMHETFIEGSLKECQSCLFWPTSESGQALREDVGLPVKSLRLVRFFCHYSRRLHSVFPFANDILAWCGVWLSSTHPFHKRRLLQEKKLCKQVCFGPLYSLIRCDCLLKSFVVCKGQKQTPVQLFMPAD